MPETKLAALPPLPGKGKAKAPRRCECGCAGLTKGGRFIPGHDSRLNGWAIRIAYGHSTEGITPGERTAAIAHIERTPKLKAAQAERAASTAKVG